jgi:hypothetical protein
VHDLSPVSSIPSIVRIVRLNIFHIIKQFTPTIGNEETSDELNAIVCSQEKPVVWNSGIRVKDGGSIDPIFIGNLYSNIVF